MTCFIVSKCGSFILPIKLSNLLESNALIWSSSKLPFFPLKTIGNLCFLGSQLEVRGTPKNIFLLCFFRTSTGRLNNSLLPQTSNPIFTPMLHHHISRSLNVRGFDFLSKHCFNLFHSSKSLCMIKTSPHSFKQAFHTTSPHHFFGIHALHFLHHLLHLLMMLNQLIHLLHTHASP